jgi:hypothetical protein
MAVGKKIMPSPRPARLVLGTAIHFKSKMVSRDETTRVGEGTDLLSGSTEENKKNLGNKLIRMSDICNASL